jgi:predicted nuclease with TOPRIM domain
LAADSRFEIVRRGYDPQPVERELKALSAELVRLKEQNAELQAETLRLNQRLQETEQELGLRNSAQLLSPWGKGIRSSLHGRAGCA